MRTAASSSTVERGPGPVPVRGHRRGGRRRGDGPAGPAHLRRRCGPRLLPQRWNGVRDPYLYAVTAEVGGDAVTVPLGLRTFAVDADRGFFLNGGAGSGTRTCTRSPPRWAATR